MQSTSPIRRYVLLRQRVHDAAASRWSMERIAPSARDGADVPPAKQRTKPDGARV